MMWEEFAQRIPTYIYIYIHTFTCIYFYIFMHILMEHYCLIFLLRLNQYDISPHSIVEHRI